jgi:hypothetical protein
MRNRNAPAARTPLALRPLGVSSAAYTAGHTPMMLNRQKRIAFSGTSSTPRPMSFSIK